MLEVTALKAQYGRIPILHGIDFHVGEGEFLGILGHNGMGKSTLLKTLIGLLRASGGAVSFEGRDITREAPFRRNRAGIGYVPQGREIFPGLSVMDNLRIAMAMHGVKNEKAVIEPVLEDLPRLKPLLERQGGVLSGGEQQILALARCLCGQPRLMLLDEPTEGIQPSIIEEIVDLLKRVRERRGLTIVLVEQNLDFIAGLAQRILIIQRGQIVREATPEQLDDPELVQEFVGLGQA